jgi:hypothetical protein
MVDLAGSPYIQPGRLSSCHASIDWLTCTQRAPRHAKRLWAAACTLIDRQILRGDDDEVWRWQGYEGRRAGPIAVGEREDGVIVRLSGSGAAENWNVFLPFAGNVSRLDYAVTGELETPDPDLARRTFRHVPDNMQTRGRPSKVTVIANRGHGDTLILGSRQSTRYCRHYDKGVEEGSAEPGVRWRWEVEIKGKEAFSEACTLVSTGDTAQRIRSIVLGTFWQKGVRAPFFASLHH